MSERVDELLKTLTNSERQELTERLLAETPRAHGGTVEERVAELERTLYRPRSWDPQHDHRGCQC